MNDKRRNALRRLILSAMFVALGIALPSFTAGIRVIGNMLCPMHLPVMLCGYVCGPIWGAVVGIVTPIFRSLIFTKPVLFPNAVAMAAELATYAICCGVLHKLLPKRVTYYYLSLVVSMLVGRVVWGAVSVPLYMIAGGKRFTFSLFLTNGFLTAFPGMILQLALVPMIVHLFSRIKRRE